MNILDIPGYPEAIARERFVRESSFLPVSETVAGFEVEQMTLKHYVMLRVIGSPFLSGTDPDALDLARFLWVMSPNYSTDNKARDAFYESCRVFTEETPESLVRFVSGVSEAQRYIQETFQDAPGSTKAGAFQPEYYSDAAWICAHFGREFGWDDDSQTMKKPMKRLFQYLKESAQYHGSKTPLFNPSDKVRGDWLDQQNKAKT